MSNPDRLQREAQEHAEVLIEDRGLFNAHAWAVPTLMNRQVNPDRCYETENGVMYMLVPVRGTPEWDVMKNGRIYRTFTSLAAAKGWLEHVLEHPESDKPRVLAAGNVSDDFKAKVVALLNGGKG